MTRAEVLHGIIEAFRTVPRPELFIRGTCWCCECAEHNETLANHTPETISMEELGSPAWDPMCFASDEAFAYYLPACVRLSFEDPYYVDQFLFHLSTPGRIDALTGPQAEAVLKAIRALTETGAVKLGADGHTSSELYAEVIQRLEGRLQL